MCFGRVPLLPAGGQVLKGGQLTASPSTRQLPPKFFMTAVRGIGKYELQCQVLGPRLRPEVCPRV